MSDTSSTMALNSDDGIAAQNQNPSRDHAPQEKILMWAAIAVIFVIAVVQRWHSLINHDVSWSLYAAQRNLAGAKLYIDLVDVNPPLIFWLMSPSVWFADMAGISISDSAKIFTFGCIAGSIGLCAAILRRIKPVAWPAGLIAITFAMTVLVGKDFAQREHLLVIFAMPFLLLVVARRENIAIGSTVVNLVSLFAAIGFCLKPYFLIVPIMLELYLLVALGWRKALFRREQLAMITLGIAYISAIFIFTPEYFSRILKYALEVYQLGYGLRYSETFWRAPIVTFASMIAYYWFFVRPSQKLDAVVKVLALSAFGLFIAFMVQSKGWPYQLYPVNAMVVVLGMMFLARGILEGLGETKRKLVLQLLLVPLLFLMLKPAIAFSYSRAKVSQWQAAVARYPGTNSVLILSDTVTQGFPFVADANLTWASRFPCSWLSPGIAKRRAQIGGTTPLIDEIETFSRRAIAEDIFRYRPQLVFVDVTENKIRFGKTRFDYIADFSKDAMFRSEWMNYEKTGTVFNFAIYKRIDR